MHFLSILLLWDTQAFLSINSFPHPQWLTIIFLISDYMIWLNVPLVLVALFHVVVSKTHLKLGQMVFIASVISMALVEVLFKKNLIHRIRPYNALENIFVYGVMPSSFSFPSGHTTNSFALATVFSLYFKNKKLSVLFYFLATIISFGRIYLGLHYPLDVIAGAFLGVFCGIAIYVLVKKVDFPIRKYYSS